MSDRCRVSEEELAHDTSKNKVVEHYTAMAEEALTDKVNAIMGGDDSSLVMDCVANSPRIEHFVMELAAIACTEAVDRMTLQEVRHLANCARELNHAMASEVRVCLDK